MHRPNELHVGAVVEVRVGDVLMPTATHSGVAPAVRWVLQEGRKLEPDRTLGPEGCGKRSPTHLFQRVVCLSRLSR